MGAGLSGLSCAITLERNGIYPTIFEKRSVVGDRFVNAEALLDILNRPVKDCISYFSEIYGIYLHPTSNINKMVIHSENEKAVIEGHFGFLNIRGRESDSFEKQLEKQVKSTIHFHSEHSYEDLLQDFTHVVLATGDAAYTKKIQSFQEDLTTTLKGATVEGNFDRFSVQIWLNNEVAPKGYAYLLPFSDTEANIVISYPEYPENNEKDISILWDRFYTLVSTTLDQSLRITDQFQIRNQIIGLCRYPRIGNTFFTGNCFGSIMPFLGFGQFHALLTGIYAAHDLCGLGNYTDLTKVTRGSYHDSLVMRRAMEKLTNSNYDTIVKGLDGYWGEKLFNAKHSNPLKLISYLLRPFIRS